MPTIFPFESLLVCVSFCVFFAFMNFIGFGFHVVELLKRRTAVRSDRKSDGRISRYDFSKLMVEKGF